MRGALWIVALAASSGACGSSAGVQISVLDNGLGATTARIFIGSGDPATRTITIEQTMFPDVQAWVRDTGVDDDTAPMSGGHADFFFEPSGGPTRMPIAIAVGFDASGAPVGGGELMAIDVPGTGYVHYDLPLAGGTSNLFTWDSGGKTTSGPPNRCARLGDHLVVTLDDQDCDGNIDGTPEECEPDVYMAATRSAIPGELTCLTSPPTANPLNNCVGGGPMCTDGMPPMGKCKPSGYCASNDLCDLCVRDGDFACAETGGGVAPSGTLGIAHFTCTIATKHDGELCGDPIALPAGAGTTCANVQLRSDQQNFQPSLQVDRDNTSLRIDASNQGCAITLTPSGKVDVSTTANGPEILRALMAVDTASFQGFLVPIVFTFAQGQSGSGSNACGPGTSHCDPSVTGMTTDASVCTIVAPKPG